MEELKMDEKWYLPKIVVTLILSLGVQLVLVILLSIACDNITRLETLISVRTVSMQPNVSISRLNVDTIHAEEIEIFPLCDLNGDIVE